MGGIMNDVELLKFAAKAVGIADLRCTETMIKTGRCYYPNDSEASDVVTRWNPLTDDGDALRLAVSLGMTIGTHAMGIYVKDTTQKMLAAHPECTNAEQHAAVRRTIVRAAAEIGKAMK